MFDTLRFARALRDGGQFTPEQSERLSDAISGEVAARADLETTESRLGRKIDDLRGDLDRNAKDLRADLRNRIRGMEARFEADTLKWIVGIIGFQSVAIIGAAIVLARILVR